MKVKTFLISILLIPVLVFGQENLEKDSFTKSAVVELQKWYNPETGLWKTTSWWNAANALTGVIRYTATTNDSTYFDVIANTFEKTKEFVVPATDNNPERLVKNFINDYYDDEGWWALAWVEAFDLTGKQEYLKMAETIFEDMATGWDEKCNGGIYWKKGLPYKSAISNELFMLLSARLALRCTNAGYYKTWALKEWNWFLQTGMINELPLVHDGVVETCEAKGRHYTYNQGVILAALVDLDKLTENKDYSELAHKIALAAIMHMSTAGGILKGHPKEEIGNDGVQFKGIFMRHLAYLHLHHPNEKFETFITENANAIKTRATKNSTFLIGSQWDGPFDKADAARQSSAIDALVSNLEAN